MRNKITIYTDWIDLIQDLPDKDVSNIFKYILGDEDVDISKEAMPSFKFIQKKLNMLDQQYKDKCLKNQENIRKRWNRTEYDGIRPYTNDTDKKIKREEDNKIKDKKILKEKINKKAYGEFKKVKLSDKETEKVKVLYEDYFDEAISMLDNYLASKGDKYKSHYAVLCKGNWVYRELQPKIKELKEFKI